MDENNILPVVLAGGKSKRFGGNKAKAKLGQYSLLEHTISKLKENFSEILIISNDDNNKVLSNIFYSKDVLSGQLGPLVGVLSSMEWIVNHSRKYNWVMTFPCDTPFFKNEIINKLINVQKKSKKKLFFLKSGKQRHNIFGLWSINLKDQLRSDLEAGYRKVEEWSNKIGAEIIELDFKDDNTFLNINTKKDLEKATKKKFNDLIFKSTFGIK